MNKQKLKERKTNPKSYNTFRTSHNSGITLIALIITIIVLLILAVVVIRAVQGDGILKRAQDGKNKYEKEASEEDRRLQAMEIFINQAIDENSYNTWDGESSDRPILDNDKNWHIYTAAQMKFLADFVNDRLTEEEKQGLEMTSTTTVYLENNLDLGARQEEGVKTEGITWEPIGYNNQFVGIFEGNNHTIKGIYVDRTETFSGVFGKAPNVIQNLTIKDCYIIGGNATGGIAGYVNEIINCNNLDTTVVTREGTYRNIGGIAGQANKVSDCNNSGMVVAKGMESGASCAGGIVGICIEKISGCINTGNVTAVGTNIGGIACQLNPGGKCDNCINKGKVESQDLNSGLAAGIICLSGGEIEGCTNKGEVISISNTGGISSALLGNAKITNCDNYGEIKSLDSASGVAIGGITANTQENASVENCNNYANVDGKTSTWVGGIVGITNSATSLHETVKNCSNTGTIKGNEQVGGVIGSVRKNNNISACYNTGVIIGGNSTAGIAGSCNGTVSESYNAGPVSGTGFTGGVIGLLSGTVNRCYNTGTVTATSSSEGYGGVVGETAMNTKITVTNCYNAGAVIGKGTGVAGIVGYFSATGASGTVQNNYNIGNISGGSNIGAVTGRLTSSAFTVSNNYALEGSYSSISNEQKKTQSEMKSDTFVDILGNTEWKIEARKNEGYPILMWQ